MTPSSALIVIDVQRGFDDPSWGRRDDVPAEHNIAALIDAWRHRDWPLVYVRHDSRIDGSPLAPDRAGNEFKEEITGVPDLLVTKSVDSAFYGDPDLDRWLRQQGIGSLVICGITTNHCCETTARMAGNLGYDVEFALDATVAFDRVSIDGEVIPAEMVRTMTGANLAGEFATIAATSDLV